MSLIASVLLLITALFVALLLIKKVASTAVKICAICLAVTLSWLLLLTMLRLGYIDDMLVVGILMGQSSLGVYYLLEKKAPRELLLFRLPVLLTLTLLVFTVVSAAWQADAWLVVGGVWLIVGLLYFYRNSQWAKGKVKSMIECCSNW